MELQDIKTPYDILEYMDNIRYGYIDIYGEEHINTLKGLRRIYRVSSLEETIQRKIGACLEQTILMSYLLDRLNIPNKMFCTRIYEPDNFDDLDADEHTHCFVLYYLDDKVHHLEHPDGDYKGIHTYNTEEEAIYKTNKRYEDMVGGKTRQITQFTSVEPGISFKEFNNYINSLDRQKEK